MAKRSARKRVSAKPAVKSDSPTKRPDATQVVAKTAGKEPSKKGPDGLTSEQRLKLLGESKQNLRESSFHEAGHAVWTFLDGRLDSIKRMRIAYKDGAVGYIQWGYMSYATKHKLPFRRSECQLAASCIAAWFSGPVCEYIHTKEDDSWNRMLDEWYGSDCEAGQSNPEWTCDFRNAMEIAFLHFRVTHRRLDSPGTEVMELLETVWGWTQELFAEPRVWRVVRTLAKALIERAPGTMWGKEVQPLIRDSWKGPRNQVPMAHLGEPYVSRFGIEAGVDRPF